MAMALNEVTEGSSYDNRAWKVDGKTFAWQRPFSRADIKRFGDAPVPAGVILAVRVEDQMEKDAVLAANAKAFFTIPHFDGYFAVLIQLEKATKKQVKEALLDAWLACAPERLTRDFLKG